MKPVLTADKARKAKPAATHIVTSTVALIDKEPKHLRDARVQEAHDHSRAVCDAQWDELKSGPFQRKGMVISRLDANGHCDGFELSFGYEFSQIFV